MNISTSECSSGCESGWTMYLDQISNSTDNNNNHHPYTKRDFGTSYRGVDQDDEDLSMVSDASSGPPHYHSHTSYSSEDVKKSKQEKYKSKETTKVNNNNHKQQQHNLCLDDTASSPVFNFPLHQDNVASFDNQQAHNFEGESVTKKQLGFFKSSSKEKSAGNFMGRKRQ